MKKNIVLALLISIGFVGQSFAAKSEPFTLDPDHSSVEFKIRHLIGKVSGRFTKVEGKIDYDADKAEKIKITGTIETASIDTGIQKRDDHLRSADFFDVDNAKKTEYKTIKFESDKFTDISKSGEEAKGKLSGKITIHGVTKPITLDLNINGKPVLDPWGNERIAYSAHGTLNRKDFGLDWNKPLEKAGGTLVGDDVELILEIEAYRKAPVTKDAKDKTSTTATEAVEPTKKAK